MPYTVAFTVRGGHPGLAARLREVAESAAGIDRPPANRLRLRRRAEADLPRLQRLLRAEGYYAARVTVALEPPEERGGPWRVHFRVEAGPRYRLGPVRIRMEGETGGFTAPDPAVLGLLPGAPARAETVLAAERRLLERARRRGHAFARLGPRRVVVDHRTRTMEVTLRLAPGPRARLARPRVTGLDGAVDEDWVRRRLGLDEGDPYAPERIARARRRLVETGLFALVRIHTGDAPDRAGRVPVLVELVPRRFRTLGGAVGWHSDESPRLRAFWEHRNLLGAGERLRLETRLARPRRELTAAFTKPDVGRLGRDLVAEGAWTVEDADTYTSRGLTLSLGLRQPLSRRWTATLGLRARIARVRERGRRDATAPLALPLLVTGDVTDDPLDPARGYRLDLALTPTLDAADPDLRFLRLRLRHTRYLRLARNPRTVLALRLAAGTLLGAERDRIPADERFYAGGGGSVRGIPFQRAGPLVRGHEPLGGRALLEGSAELRLRVAARLELAGFVDAGTVFTASLPDPSERRPRVGAGVGVRYLSPVGPIRLDLAVPVDRDPAVDDPFQLYLGLGQPF